MRVNGTNNMVRSSINNMIGFYDIRNLILYSEHQKDELLYSKDLPHGIRIHLFNNLYWYLDFQNSQILKAASQLSSLEEFNNKVAPATLHFQKEMINAFNACIYIVSRNTQDKKVRNGDAIQRLNFINVPDQYFIPHNNSQEPKPLSFYLRSADFSTEMYRMVCQNQYAKPPKDTKILHDHHLKAINILSSLLENDCLLKKGEFNKSWFYILAHIWKVVFYISHDLRLEAISLSRSIFEVMVKRKHGNNGKDLTQENYKSYCNDERLSKRFLNIKPARDQAVHELIPIDHYDMLHDSRACLKGLINLFNRDTGSDISSITK